LSEFSNNKHTHNKHNKHIQFSYAQINTWIINR